MTIDYWYRDSEGLRWRWRSVRVEARSVSDHNPAGIGRIRFESRAEGLR